MRSKPKTKAALLEALAAKMFERHALARLGQPIVIYMAITHVAAIARALREGGLAAATPAAVIASATTPKQRVLITTLGDLPEALSATIPMWVDGILKGTPIPFGVEEGIQLTELMQYAYVAAKEKRQVDIPARA